MNFKFLIKKNVQLARCPNCGTIAALRRSRSRNILEKILKKIKLSPYFCQSCGWRGKVVTYKLSKNYLQLIFMYIIIMLISAYIVQKFLRSYFD
ncbi:MAG: hypothetical protein NTV87_16195 [Ignavibacteriae bacterium]|nr:hypothetical protein [Ignavibacteriota bacterium]